MHMSPKQLPIRSPSFVSKRLRFIARAVADRPDVEADVRYNRADDSSLHAYTARWRFASNVSEGEPGMNLAELSLLISAEDDAIMSHSTVPFPVEAYLNRIEVMANDFEKRLRAGPRDLSSEAVVGRLEDFLYQELRIVCGESNLPPNSMIDHPGVYEDPRWAYLDQLLIRKKGDTSVVAILMSQIIKILISRQMIDFSVTVDLSAPSTRPRMLVLPGFSNLTLPSQDLFKIPNSCTSDTLRRSLAHLKRSYWPLPWDTSVKEGDFNSHGGFLSGAKAAVGEAMSAQLRAISTVANWRLERGIWTSPGAGDWRRCRAACERLILVSESLQDDPEVDLDRRDLGVLLMMSGELDQAYVELEAYESSSSYSLADGVQRILVKRMLDSLVAVRVQKVSLSPVSIHTTLAGPPPNEWAAPKTKRPLTW